MSVPTAPTGGSVVLACPYQLLSAGITQRLTDGGWTVVGVAAAAAEARELVRVHRPDICLVLVPFPEGTAELVASLTALPARPRVVCLSSDVEMGDNLTARRVFASGADGWLTLDLAPEVLARTLDAVRAGEAAVSRRHVRLLLGELSAPRADLVRRPDRDDVVITSRQQQVMQAVVARASTQQIAPTSASARRPSAGT